MKAIASNILLIDNNDSFTYNIIDLLKKQQCGNLAVIRSGELSIDQLKTYSHLIISPGPGLPTDFPVLKEVIGYAVHKGVPLLGICLGHQAICQYFGGELIQLKEVIHGRQSTTSVYQSGRLHEDLPESAVVGRYHSWAIDKSTLPDEIQVTGVASDRCLMSVQHRYLPVFGVQYHPESFLTSHGRAIMKNFTGL